MLAHDLIDGFIKNCAASPKTAAAVSRLPLDDRIQIRDDVNNLWTDPEDKPHLGMTNRKSILDDLLGRDELNRVVFERTVGVPASQPIRKRKRVYLINGFKLMDLNYR